MCVCVSVRACVRTCLYVSVRACVCVCECVYVCGCVCSRARLSVCVRARCLVFAFISGNLLHSASFDQPARATALFWNNQQSAMRVLLLPNRSAVPAHLITCRTMAWLSEICSARCQTPCTQPQAVIQAGCRENNLLFRILFRQEI